MKQNRVKQSGDELEVLVTLGRETINDPFLPDTGLLNAASPGMKLSA
jgi:hypothetical protein